MWVASNFHLVARLRMLGNSFFPATYLRRIVLNTGQPYVYHSARQWQLKRNMTASGRTACFLVHSMARACQGKFVVNEISLRTEHCSKRTVIANTLRHLTITCRRHAPDVDRIIHSFSKEENLMKQRTRAT